MKIEFLSSPIKSNLKIEKGIVQPRKDLMRLYQENQVSQLEVKIADFLTMLGINFVYGFTLPSFTSNTNYTTDFYFPEYDTALEIDSVFHDKPSAMSRDKRKLEVAEEVVGLNHFKRYRNDLPNSLIYRNNTGDLREEKKQIYETWNNGRVMEAIQKIVSLPKVEELKTPPIFEDEDIKNKYQIKLDKLKNKRKK